MTNKGENSVEQDIERGLELGFYQREYEITYFGEMKSFSLELLKLLVPYALIKAVWEFANYIGRVIVVLLLLICLPITALVVYRLRKALHERLHREIMESIIKK